MRSIAAVVAAIAVLVLLDPQGIEAQRGRGAAPSRGPAWLPRTVRLETPGLTQAERASALGTLTEIDRVFAEADALARPVGFELEPSFYGLSPHDSVLSYMHRLTAYVPVKRGAEGADCVTVDVNNVPSRGINAINGYSDERGAFFVEDQVLGIGAGRPFEAAHGIRELAGGGRHAKATAGRTSGRVSRNAPAGSG